MLGLSLTRRSGAMPQEPTTAAPGSEAKVQVLMERASRRETLFHPNDATIAQARPAIPPAETAAPDCPNCVVTAPDTELLTPEASPLEDDPVSDLERAG
jgi:hypothetical protein